MPMKYRVHAILISEDDEQDDILEEEDITRDYDDAQQATLVFQSIVELFQQLRK